MSRTDDGLRIMTVLAAQHVTPHMLRLRLGGNDLHRFNTFKNLHIRLHVPVCGEALRRFSLSDDHDPAGVATRYYTIRHIDPVAGWLDIDFVLHTAAGPVCDFARRAVPGDICAISGPCGLGVKPARHYLLAGDETALPAIARIAEALPDQTTGCIMLDVKDADSVPVFKRPRCLELECCYRTEDRNAFIGRVGNAIAQTAPGSDSFLWLAGSFDAYEAFRPLLRAIPKSQTINVPYWRATPVGDGTGKTTTNDHGSVTPAWS